MCYHLIEKNEGTYSENGATGKDSPRSTHGTIIAVVIVVAASRCGRLDRPAGHEYKRDKAQK
jgi:hypothetical protein